MNLANTEIQEGNSQPGVLDRPLMEILPAINLRMIIALVILVLAVVSRFYNIDLRVMSHDEVNHVVPSYDLYSGKGYRHDPVTHGPMQFHLVATSYFMLGDSDFSSRVPAALFSIAAIAFILFFMPRYLGKNGALITAFLFMISPYLLFYGRYTRNEGFIELLGVMMLFATLAYLETGKHSCLYLLTVSLVLHFCTKETSYIYTAQLLIFLALNFLRETSDLRSLDLSARRRFNILALAAGVCVLLVLGTSAWGAGMNKPVNDEVATAAAASAISAMPVWVQGCIYGGLAGALMLGVLALANLVGALGWDKIRRLRSFDLLVLVITLILPQLVALPIKLVGWDPLDYSSNGMIHTGIFILVSLAISVAVGYWWKGTTWLKNAALFYVIFVVLYTTFFTNGRGFFTGIVGSLGYWLAQQGVQRGSQPWYFYSLIQVPVYEYIAALGTILALYFGIRYKRLIVWASGSPADPSALVVSHESDTPDWLDDAETEHEEESIRPVPALALILFWSLLSLAAYSVAGEKMPWLTVHIALPMLLSAGWGIGFLIDCIDWKRIGNLSGLLATLLVPVLLAAGAGVLGGLLGTHPPFQGSTLDQLQATSRFVVSVVGLIASAAGIFYLLRDWRTSQIISLTSVVIFAVLAVLTARAAYRASYINYDQATE